MSLLILVLFGVFQHIAGSLRCEGKDIMETNKDHSTEFKLPDLDDIIIAFKVLQSSEGGRTEIKVALGPSDTDTTETAFFYYGDEWRFIDMHKNQFRISTERSANYDNNKNGVPLVGRNFSISSNGPVCWRMFLPEYSTECETTEMALSTTEQPGNSSTETLCNVTSCKAIQDTSKKDLIVYILVAAVCGLLVLLLAMICYNHHLRKIISNTRKKTSPTMQFSNSTVLQDDFQARNASGIPVERPNSTHDSENSIYGAVVR